MRVQRLVVAMLCLAAACGTTVTEVGDSGRRVRVGSDIPVIPLETILRLPRFFAFTATLDRVVDDEPFATTEGHYYREMRVAVDAIIDQRSGAPPVTEADITTVLHADTFPAAQLHQSHVGTTLLVVGDLHENIRGTDGRLIPRAAVVASYNSYRKFRHGGKDLAARLYSPQEPDRGYQGGHDALIARITGGKAVRHVDVLPWDELLERVRNPTHERTKQLGYDEAPDPSLRETPEPDMSEEPDNLEQERGE